MFTKKIKEKLDSLKDQSSTIIHLMKVDEKTQEERISICRECPYLFKTTETCKKCGCFMNVKTWLKNASCPLKKW